MLSDVAATLGYDISSVQQGSDVKVRSIGRSL